MTQTSKCLNTLVKQPTEFPKQNVEYSITHPKKIVAYDSEVFFKNLDKENCPIANCTLMAKGCKLPLYSEKKIFMKGKSN
jgi:hypothetical protein